MALCQSLTLRQEPRILQDLRLALPGDTVGDVPVYSLHRIKRLLSQRPLAVTAELRGLMMRNVVAVNRAYREETGRNWMCLTSHGLTEVIDTTDEQIQSFIRVAVTSVPREQAKVAHRIGATLEKQGKDAVDVLKNWFYENYDDLIYDMSGQVPWPVIQRLRRSLSSWIVGLSNPFGQHIDELVVDVAREQGIIEEDPERAWIAMGGTLFTVKDNL